MNFLMLALILPMLNSGQLRLVDVTGQSGITFEHVSAPEKKYIVESMSGGVVVFDFDGDGLQDLY
ncbi:MAG TPA: hypothetical protein VLU25_13565, partial [Acidobacteriota bacterium]|nr:hypothetical protein [Acidobacteriota bacterium]